MTRKPDNETKGTEVPSAVLERAEDAVRRLAAGYTEWVQADLARLDAAYAAIAAAPVCGPEHLEPLLNAAHDIKGQGGSFGYPLMTRIGGSLCRYVERLDDPAAIDLALVDAHRQAMRAIVDNRMKGDDDPVGRQITERLRALIDREDGGGAG